MLKKITGFMAVALLCLSIGGCRHTGEQQGYEEDDNRALSLVVATDLHYLSPKLTDNGEAFTKMMSKADGKMTKYVDQLTDAFLAEVTAAKPDALVLCGDLAFNGEKQSHLDLAQKLEAVRAQGIPVAVIPGNHDIQYPFSYRYEGEEIYGTSNVSPETFKEIYQNLGYAQAISRDENSFSYVFPLSDQVRLLLLDANTVKKPGSILDETLIWAEGQLADAKNAGATVIGVTHQNVMVHNDLFIRGYRIGNYNKVLELFEKYGVQLNLSGHIHIQNIARDTDFCEAATGSLSVWPNLYAAVEVSEQRDISYQTRSVDVSGWAKAQRAEIPELLEFETAAREEFDRFNTGKILDELDYLEVTDSQKDMLKEFAADVNRLYFAGRLGEQREQLREEEAWKLLEEKGDWLFLKEYMDSIMTGKSKSDRELLISANAPAEPNEQ